MPRRFAVTWVLALLVLGSAPALAAGRGKKKAGGATHESGSSGQHSSRKPVEVPVRGGVEDPLSGAAAAPGSATTSGAAPSRGPTRIDFDDRLIQGQTNKSGAVYLYERKELKIRSMVKKRESFRDEIVRSVYDD